jgi:hypothetical protein
VRVKYRDLKAQIYKQMLPEGKFNIKMFEPERQDATGAYFVVLTKHFYSKQVKG